LTRTIEGRNKTLPPLLLILNDDDDDEEDGDGKQGDKDGEQYLAQIN
jgi:hypothetical protein